MRKDNSKARRNTRVTHIEKRSMMDDYYAVFGTGGKQSSGRITEQHGLKQILKYNKELTKFSIETKDYDWEQVMCRNKVTGEYAQVTDYKMFRKGAFGAHTFLLSTDWIPVYIRGVVNEDYIRKTADKIEDMLKKEVEEIEREAETMKKIPYILLYIKELSLKDDTDIEDEEDKIKITEKITMIKERDTDHSREKRQAFAYALKDKKLYEVYGSAYDYKVNSSSGIKGMDEAHIFTLSDELCSYIGLLGNANGAYIRLAGSPAKSYTWRIPDTPAAWQRMPVKPWDIKTLISLCTIMNREEKADSIKYYVMGHIAINLYKGKPKDRYEEEEMRHILRCIYIIEDVVKNMGGSTITSMKKAARHRIKPLMEYIAMCLREESTKTLMDFIIDRIDERITGAGPSGR